MISKSDFEKIDIRIGRIEDVEEVEGARKPIYKLLVDFGEEGKRTIAAGIKDRYKKEELIGIEAAFLFNIEPKNVAGVESQGMVLAAEDEKEISILIPMRKVKPGARVF
ncbi:MAG: hypothetical protein QXL16_00585 [Candidatus Micrarchaeaceae archaeon]